MCFFCFLMMGIIQQTKDQGNNNDPQTIAMQGWPNCIGTHPENKLVSILINIVFSTSDSLIESNYT